MGDPRERAQPAPTDHAAGSHPLLPGADRGTRAGNTHPTLRRRRLQLQRPLVTPPKLSSRPCRSPVATCHRPKDCFRGTPARAGALAGFAQSGSVELPGRRCVGATGGGGIYR